MDVYNRSACLVLIYWLWLCVHIYMNAPKARMNCFSLLLSQWVWNLRHKGKQKHRKQIRIEVSAILFDLSVDLFISLRWLVCSLHCHVLSARDSLANIEHAVKFCDAFSARGRTIRGHATLRDFNRTTKSHHRKRRVAHHPSPSTLWLDLASFLFDRWAELTWKSRT